MFLPISENQRRTVDLVSTLSQMLKLRIRPEKQVNYSQANDLFGDRFIQHGASRRRETRYSSLDHFIVQVTKDKAGYSCRMKDKFVKRIELCGKGLLGHRCISPGTRTCLLQTKE